MRKLGTEGSDPIDKEALACGCETAKAPCGVCAVPKKCGFLALLVSYRAASLDALFLLRPALPDLVLDP